ncbi:MAG: DNA polymerase III subunit delta' [Anaeromyxobacter sp.]
MPFSEVTAQDRALGALRAALRRGALHHAYLFGGPEGTGKGRAAQLLAQAANCEGGEATSAPGYRDDPCGACGPCRKIARGVHPDVMVLHEERVMAKAGTWEPKGGRSPSKDVVVDQVRDLVDHRLAMKRFEGRRRFVIIDPADAMNPQAQNALLKTLEEPPEETTLVLVAASPDVLLPTIRSRCLRVPFGPVPDALVVQQLVAKGRSEEEARLAAALAAGSLGRALALDPAALDGLRDAVRAAVALDPDDAGGWLAFARDHGEDREQAGELCALLALWLRDVLALQAGGAALALADLAPESRRAAAALTAAEVVRRRGLVEETAAGLRQNASPVLALEGLFIGWFHGRAA